MSYSITFRDEPLVSIDDDLAKAIEQKAAEAGMTPEDFVRKTIADKVHFLCLPSDSTCKQSR